MKLLIYKIRKLHPAGLGSLENLRAMYSKATILEPAELSRGEGILQVDSVR